MTSEARATSRSSATVMLYSLLGGGVTRSVAWSEVRVVEGWLAAVVEGADALDAVRVDGGAPVRVHHDRDRLLDRLAFTQLHRALHRLDRGRGVACDLVRDLVGGGHQPPRFMDLVDHA